jgi:hypothetical protein
MVRGGVSNTILQAYDLLELRRRQLSTAAARQPGPPMPKDMLLAQSALWRRDL